MSNTFDYACRRVVDQLGKSSPEFLSTLWELMLRLNEEGRSFGGELRDAIMQSFGSPFASPYDAYGFAIVWAGILRGEVGYAILPLGVSCGPDSAVARNNLGHLRFSSDGDNVADLQCEVHFVGGAGYSDGYFKTESPLVLQRHLRTGRGCSNQIVMVNSRTYALEVGSTSVLTTVEHVFAETGVARWPYDSENLVVLHRFIDDEAPLSVLEESPCEHSHNQCSGANRV